MQKLLTAAITLTILSGCGTMGAPNAIKRTGAMQAQSAAGVAKGVRAVFKAAFKATDKDGNAWLSLAEFAAAMPVAPTQPGAAPIALDPAAVQAKFDAFDLNHDKKIRFGEYQTKDGVAEARTVVRYEAGKIFAQLDRNGDRVLVEAELVSPMITMASADKNKNGKLTASEFEDAFAALLAGGPDPVEPPAPAVDPVPAPAPGADEPAPPAEEPTEPTEQPAAEPTEG